MQRLIPVIALAAGLAAPLAAPAASPVAAVMESDPGLPESTVFRPQAISAASGKLPILVFAEGGCRNIGNRSAPMMLRIAAQGYLVMVAGPPSPWSRSDTMRDDNEKPADGFPVYSHARQLREAVDWAARENKRRGSRYFGRLDLGKVASMGVSCGGLQALDHTVADPRVTNTLVIYSGLFPDGVTPGAVKFAGLKVRKADRSRIDHPILYLYGGEKDIAHPNAEDDYAFVKSSPAFAASLKASGHGDELGAPAGGRFGALIVDWLNWWFKGDSAAGRSFIGPDCAICADPAWTVKSKNLPPR